jgi:hypothetical protein
MFLRKIKDIRISNKKISVIRDADISIDDLENQINQIVYSPARDNKNIEEENAKLPPFIQVFYFLFFSYLRIPSEIDFWKTYLTWVGGENENGEVEIEGIKYKSEGLKSRLNRTYPSLIRDLHFLYLIEASKKFEQVDYSMDRDYFNGLDLRVTHNNKEVFISLFIDTLRSRYFKQKKTKRHNYSTVHEIEFIVDFNSLTRIGSIDVLNQSHIKLLENILNGFNE